METLEDAQRVRELIARCVDGDAEAAREFQAAYGELIYGYPQRVYRTPAEDAGDFYVFAFHGGRIFRRVRTFEGRAPFRAYLLGFVLDDLILEWKRAARRIDTVSMDDVNEMTLQQAGERDMANDAASDPLEAREIGELLAQLDVGKVVVVKLLHAEDYDLSAEEIRHIAEVSGRSEAEVQSRIATLRATIRDRETALRAIEDTLESAQAWIQLYQRRMRRIDEDLAALQPGATVAARLREERVELERKTARREQQREKLRAQAQRRKVTAPYKEIADILSTTTGNIGSQISRLRIELARVSGGTQPELDLDRTGDTHGAS